MPFMSDDIDLDTHSLTGWPRKGKCTQCGAPAALLWATGEDAQYECRGTPAEPSSAYGDDRCGASFVVQRT